jgi:hypothetical protein
MAEVGKIVPSRAGLLVDLRVRYVCSGSINNVMNEGGGYRNSSK